MLETNHVSLSAATTGTGTVARLDGQAQSLRAYARWASGVTSGEVVLEEADDPDYTGTWAPIGTFNFDSNAISVIEANAGAMIAVRARVTTTIAGGGSPSVTVRIVAVSGSGG